MSHHLNTDPLSTNPASASSHTDASFIHTGGAAGPGYLCLDPRLHREDHQAGHHGVPENHVCLHPGCGNFNWPNEVLLDEHVKKEHIAMHLATPLPSPSTASLRSDQDSQGYQTACGSSTTNSTTTQINKHIQLDFVAYTPSHSKSSPSTPPAKPFACGHEGCQSSFDQVGSLTRHMKNHKDGLKDFSCFADGCNRNGNNGFTRLDKVKEHVTSRHLLTDFHIYIKGVKMYHYNKTKGGSQSHRFLSWRKARQDWQTENPSDEMPPWLTGEALWAAWARCPECQVVERLFGPYPILNDHWQTEHSSTEMPLWMNIDKLPEWWC